MELYGGEEWNIELDHFDMEREKIWEASRKTRKIIETLKTRKNYNKKKIYKMKIIWRII